MPVSSFTCTGTPSGISSFATTSSSRASRAWPISRFDGRPEHEDPRVRELAAQLERLAARSRRRAPVAPSPSAAPGDVDGAVAVAVRLDDRPQLGARRARAAASARCGGRRRGRPSARSGARPHRMRRVLRSIRSRDVARPRREIASQSRASLAGIRLNGKLSVGRIDDPAEDRRPRAGSTALERPVELTARDSATSCSESVRGPMREDGQRACVSSRRAVVVQEAARVRRASDPCGSTPPRTMPSYAARPRATSGCRAQLDRRARPPAASAGDRRARRHGSTRALLHRQRESSRLLLLSSRVQSTGGERVRHRGKYRSAERRRARGLAGERRAGSSRAGRSPQPDRAGSCSRAASPWTAAAAAAASRASIPLARNAATTPVRTSPVPAVASAGVAEGRDEHALARCGDERVRALEQADAAEALGRRRGPPRAGARRPNPSSRRAAARARRRAASARSARRARTAPAPRARPRRRRPGRRAPRAAGGRARASRRCGRGPARSRPRPHALRGRAARAAHAAAACPRRPPAGRA